MKKEYLMNKFNQCSISVLLMTLIVGCGSSGSSSNNSAFDGTWTDDCLSFSDEESEDNLLTIDGEEATFSINEYSTGDCTGEVSNNVFLTFSFTYGELLPSASSICSNTQEIDIVETSRTVNGIDEPTEEDESFNILCTSPDGAYLYDGDFDSVDGQTPETRPNMINDDNFLTRQ